MTASYQNLASQAAATGAPRNWRPWRRRALWAGGLIWAWSVLIITGLQADPIDRAVMLSAAVTNDPPTITLNWQLTRQDDADYIYIFRSQDALIGGSQIAYLEGPDHTNFTDTNVVVGQAYHYSAIASIGGRHTAQGYISSGIDVPLADSRGTVILILDGGFSQSLEDEYDLLAQNLAGDGWTVERYDVPRAYRPFDIRNTIRTAYSNDPDNVKSVFLFGRIPVVLSGPVCPDGHIEEHTVHYATDAFYADMHVEVTNYFPDSTDYWQPDAIGYFSNRAAYTDLAIGRVDLSFLPAMGDEAELLKQYIQKNHNYRHRLFEWQAKGFIHDEFGDYADDAKVGWRDFSAILGHTNVMAGWWRTLREPPFLWGYGCGGGYYNSCGNVINTGQMKTHDPAVFTFLFGSYFCDWYTANNLLRAQLATPEHGLTCAWGDAHVVSSMGLGGCIGECIKIRQNKGGVHVGLMGDPTLRIQYITPPSNLVADTQNHLLQWDPVPEEGIMEGELEGYNIYRSLNRYGPFTRLNHSPIQDTSYIMDDPTAQQHYYMVRAVALLDHNSGRYYDASQGIFTSAIFTPPLVPSASGGNHADKIAVSWTPQHDTLAYEVWRSQYYRDPSLAEMVAVTTSTNYDDTEVTPSIFYYYWIKAQTPLGTTDFDLSAEGWRSWVSTPTDVMASDGSYRDKVLISWTPSPNAIDYVIYRNTSSVDSGATVIGNTTGTSFDDTTARPGVTYTYWVCGINNSGYSSGFSLPDTGRRATTPAPPDPALTNRSALRMTDFQMAPTVMPLGSIPSLFSVRMLNTGPTATSAWVTLTAHLAPGGVFGARDNTSMGSVKHYVSLLAGQSVDILLSKAERKSLQVPHATPLGTYTVFLQSTTPDARGTNSIIQLNQKIQVVPSRLATREDFDGDGTSDLVMYEEGSGRWLVRASATGRDTTFYCGGPGYQPLSGDFDGDGIFDPMVYAQASGHWITLLSGSLYARITIDNFGGPDYVPVAGDFDGDGVSDPAIYHTETGLWTALLSGQRYAPATAALGGAGYVPVAGDFDGDGISDPAVYQTETGLWIVLLSGQQYAPVTATLGGPGYVPVIGDFDGDGISDPAVFQEATGLWLTLLSGQAYSPAAINFHLPQFQVGQFRFLPVAGDFDGDGITDPTIYQVGDGIWHAHLSRSRYQLIQISFGGGDYQPVNN